MSVAPVLDPQQEAAMYDALLGNAWDMVQSLSSIGPGTAPGPDAATRGFQDAWNAIRHVVEAQLDLAGATDEAMRVVTRGLTTDGVFGRKTGLALGFTLFSVRDIAQIQGFYLPMRRDEVGTWYATFKPEIDDMLMPYAAEPAVPPQPSQGYMPPMPQGNRVPVPPINPNGQINQMVPGADEPAGDGSVTFEDGTTVQSKSGRETSLAPVLAVGLGVVAVGGLLFFASRAAA